MLLFLAALLMTTHRFFALIFLVRQRGKKKGESLVVFFLTDKTPKEKKNDRRFNRSSFYTETKYTINPNKHTSNSSNLRQKKEGEGELGQQKRNVT